MIHEEGLNEILNGRKCRCLGSLIVQVEGKVDRRNTKRRQRKWLLVKDVKISLKSESDKS